MVIGCLILDTLWWFREHHFHLSSPCDLMVRISTEYLQKTAHSPPWRVRWRWVLWVHRIICHSPYCPVLCIIMTNCFCELSLRSLACYFGVYCPRCFATREINTKITREWSLKPFVTKVHTSFSMYHVCWFLNDSYRAKQDWHRNDKKTQRE